jgi:ABC-2 type transport system permease protein
MTEPTEPSATRVVALIARREFLSRLRTRAFLVGTVAIILLLSGYVLFETALANRGAHSVVGLSGQSTVLADQVRAAGKAFGREVDTQDVTDPAKGADQVRSGALDALVTGPPYALTVTVRTKLDDSLRNALDSVVREQVLTGQLAEAGLDPRKVESTMAGAKVSVTTLEPTDPLRVPRLVVGIVVAVLLFYSLVVYGTMVAQGVVEEKSSRVVEVLLAVVRPWQLLLGKVLGLGAVGLLQLLAIGGVGTALALGTGLLTTGALPASVLLSGVVWYLVGFFLYTTVYAAAASLVSRQEELQSVLAPVSMVVGVGFVVGVNLMVRDPADRVVEVLSLLPPFAPVLMPGRVAVGVAPAWQVLVALLLALAAIAALTWLGGRVYANAVLHTGGRMSLREALRGNR